MFTTTEEKNLNKVAINSYLTSVLKDLKTLDYEIEEEFSLEELKKTLNEDLPTSKLHIERDCFNLHVVSLCESFFHSTKSKKIKILLEVISSDMCRLFHVDNIRQRLLCTYMGPGTEWLEHSNVNREGLGKGENNLIVKDMREVKRTELLEPILLKGLLYGEGQFADVHRSPPVENEGLTRVLLKIDEIH